MLYLILIASLCIYKATAQCDSASDADECEALGGCEVASRACLIEGWFTGCCLSVPTLEPTTNQPTTAQPTTDEPTLAPTCPTDYDTCEDYTEAGCCPTECVTVDTGLCASEGGPGCCTTPTTTTDEPTTSEPTTAEPTTDEPTLAPTCPTDYDECEDYSTWDCCPDECERSSENICKTEGGPDCCITPTTTELPTTTEEEPTTTERETTEAETTEAETTEAETTEAETTEAETTEAETTKTETTKAETTEAETTEGSEEESTTTETPEETTKTNKWPTPQPTMRSAEKWAMIHPAYEGSNGELLWHVYYGDFSNDDRFDSFRKGEKWDTKEIKPIIMHDKQFKKYRNANSKKFRAQSAVVADNNAGSSSYGSWLIGISAVLIILFAVWYKFAPKNNKSAEYTPLLTEEKVQYDQ